MAKTPEHLQPGIGLRPRARRPDLEEFVRKSYADLWEHVRQLAEEGRMVVVDVGLHADYAADFDAWAFSQSALAGLEVIRIGVMCPPSEIMKRRRETNLVAPADRVLLWESAVHGGRTYDLIIDTSCTDPDSAARLILDHLRSSR